MDGMNDHNSTVPPPTSYEFRVVVEAAAESVFVAQDGMIKYANPAAEALLGYAQADLGSTPFVAFVHEEDRTMVLDRHVRRLRGEAVAERYAFRVVDRSGATKWVEIKPVVTTWAGHPATLNFLRDVSETRAIEAERQRLERQLEQAHRLEALGVLAGGVAHDMNNVLGAVMGFASAIQGEGGVDAGHVEDLEGILSACARGRDLCIGLLGVARRGDYKKRAIDLHTIVRDVERILKHTVSKAITIAAAAGTGSASVEADGAQLVNAILNLCVNATQAMPDGGELRLRVDRRVIGEDARELLVSGPYMVLEIADTGVGMDAETMRRALEPFFTTKAIGNGSGLGLSMAYALARSHGGTLTLESAPGTGTTVTLLLPESAAGTRSPTTRPPARRATRRDAGTVLVVDDEPLVRRATQRLLRGLGRDSLVTSNGRAALDAYRASPRTIAVAVIDLMMPGMSGFELFRELRAATPELPIVIASGGSSGTDVATLLDEPRTALLGKPFDAAELADALDAVEGVDRDDAATT